MGQHPITALEILANSNFHLVMQQHPKNLIIGMAEGPFSKLVIIAPAKKDLHLNWIVNTMLPTKYSIAHFMSEGIGRIRFDLNGIDYSFDIYQKQEDLSDRNLENYASCSFESYRKRVAEIEATKE